MPPSMRDKAAALRREHILEAATRVFAARGFHRATIRDVAREAGVADGTIYNAFENKAALLFGIVEAHLGQSGTGAAALPDVAPGDALRTLLAERWRTFDSGTLAAMRVVLAEVLVDDGLRRRYFETVIAPTLALPTSTLAGSAGKPESGSSDTAMVSRLVIAAFFGLVMLRLLGDEALEANAQEVPDRLATLLLDGLRPREGGQA